MVGHIEAQWQCFYYPAFCFPLSAVLPITNHPMKFRKRIFRVGYFARKSLHLFQALKNASAPSDGGNEADYLAAFLDARVAVMQPE